MLRFRVPREIIVIEIDSEPSYACVNKFSVLTSAGFVDSQRKDKGCEHMDGIYRGSTDTRHLCPSLSEV